MVGDVVAALEETTLEEVEEEEVDVTTRHRKERKELQSKIQALKKNAPKSDKKKRKEVMEEVARLEAEMDQRHATELKKAAANHQPKQQKSNSNGSEEPEATQPELENDSLENAPQQRISKAQKRRDKKAQEQRARDEEERAAAADIDQNGPKATEARQLQAKLKERQLALHQVHSDGDCLYNAVRHQLQQCGLVDYGLQQLRAETANYIRANKDSLIWYMTHPSTGVALNDAEFEAYCEAVSSTPAWGGQVELEALSAILKVPIEVLQADGSSVVHGADAFPGPNLLIVYHRTLYSLGEHYNSTLPLTEARNGDSASSSQLVDSFYE